MYARKQCCDVCFWFFVKCRITIYRLCFTHGNYMFVCYWNKFELNISSLILFKSTTHPSWLCNTLRWCSLTWNKYMHYYLLLRCHPVTRRRNYRNFDMGHPKKNFYLLKSLRQVLHRITIRAAAICICAWFARCLSAPRSGIHLYIYNMCNATSWYFDRLMSFGWPLNYIPCIPCSCPISALYSNVL